MSRRLTRPSATAALLAVVVATALWQAPQSFVDAVREISSRRDLSQAERALAPVRANDFPVEVFTGAAAAIPADATYHVVVGDNLPLHGNQEIALTPLLRYWLFPRRWTSRLEDAEWVLAYGASTETLGVPVGASVNQL